MANSLVLEIDGGNSSYKWRLLNNAETVSSGRFNLNELLPGFEAVFQEVGENIEVRVVSVAGERADSCLLGALKTLGMDSVQFARVEREKAGVRCGYDDLSQLGVDRWLAILAAANEFEGPLAIADFGTALTLDFVDANKNHRGGYIVPGWRLLCQALIDGTAIDVSRIPYEFDSSALCPGTSSAWAIGQGRILMLASFVNEGVAGFEREERQKVRLICTGGDASRVLPFFGIDVELRPDLVLDGLALAMAQI